MASRGNELVRRALASYNARRREYATLALVALLVTVSVALGLHQRGIAATHSEQVLDCQYSGSGAHTHDESCYDASGNLVCPLEEREYHVHDDSCYEETRQLACGLQEHAHTDACYDEEGNLACELEDHQHSDACYQVNRVLSCTRDEVTEVHTHGPGCFREVQVEDVSLDPQDAGQDPASGELGTEDDSATLGDAADNPSDQSMPEQAFAHEFKDQDDNLVLRVDAKAPEGALPEGSAMQAEWIDPTTLTKKAQDAVSKALSKKAEGAVLAQQAVDITFLDAEGNKVEPSDKVMVTFTSAILGTDDQATVVHIDDITEKQLAEMQEALDEGKSIDEVEPDRRAEVVDCLADEELQRRSLILDVNQVAIDSNQFSTFVLSVTSLHQELLFEGNDVTVTVDAPAEAGVPAGATLQVTEIIEGTDEHEAYQDAAMESMGVDDERDVALARFFDIKILDANGQEIQPGQSVQVSIDLANAPKKVVNTDVVHFDSETGAPELMDATEDAGTSTFEAEGFSVYGVVYTVDFHWAVNGKKYEFSIPGGGFVSLEKLVELLGVADAEGSGGLSEAQYEEDDSVLTLADVQVSEMTKTFVKDVMYVEFSDASLMHVSKVEKDTSAGQIKKRFGLDCEYSAELTEEQIEEINAETVEAGDWALISLRPFHTEETLTVTMKTGELFSIKVTDAQGTVWNGGADTRSQGITINLFNYGPEDSLDTVNNAIGATVTNDGINQYSDLKFLSRGTVGTSINHFTGSAPNEYAAQGIVQPKLIGGYPALQTDHGSTSLSYLFDEDDRDGKTTYSDVNMLMWQSGNGYLYDSDQRYAYFNKDTTQNPNKNFTLYNDTYLEEGADQSNPFKIGFFPFNDYDNAYHCIHGYNFNWGKKDCSHQGHYDHHFGMTMSATFMMDSTNNMDFHFSGDDDMWVFVDDVLVLDIGGIHNPIDGDINFNNGTVSVTRPNSHTDARRPVDNQTIAPNTIAAAFERAGKTWNGADGTYHEIKVFYLERGGMYSNLEVEIKLPTVLSGNVSFNKKNDSNAAQPGATFSLFTDEDCQIPLSFKSENATAVSDENGVVTFSGLPVGTYYMKETVAPDGYRVDPNVYKVMIRDKNTSTSEITTLSGEPVSTIINTEDVVELGVQKLWQNQNGTAITPNKDFSATFKVVRLRSYTTSGEVVTGTEDTLQIRRVANDASWAASDGLTYKYLRGRTVTINYDYHGGSGNSGKRQYRYSTNNGQSWGYSANNLSETGSFNVTIPNSGQYLIEFYDSGNNVTWTIDDGATPGQTVTDEEDTDFTCEPITLMNGVTSGTFNSGLYVGTAKAGKFPGQETKNGIKYTYKYYIVETDKYPSDAQTVYINSQGEVVSDSNLKPLGTSGDLNQTIINRVNTGSLKITKEVTYNYINPATGQLTEAQTRVLAGTYTFKLYTNELCTDAYVYPDHDDPLEINIEVGEDGQPVASNVYVLPVGTYWLKETKTTNQALFPVTNGPIELNVTAEHTTEQPLETTFTNNYEKNDDQDKIVLDIEKTFTGLLSPNHIPDNFEVVLTYKVGNEPKTIHLHKDELDEQNGARISTTTSPDGYTLHWRITNLPADATDFKLHEDHYDEAAGYTWTLAKLDGVEMTNPKTDHDLVVTAPAATLQNVTGIREESDNDKNYKVFEHDVILVSLTGSGNSQGSNTDKHGTLVVSQTSLNKKERDAISGAVTSLNGSWKTPCYFFSIEEHPEGFFYKDTTVKFNWNEEKGCYIVHVEHKQSSMEEVFVVSYSSQSSLNNAELENFYEETPIELEVIKVEEGNRTTKLPGAIFTLRQIADEEATSNGTYGSAQGTTLMTSNPTAEETGKTSFSNLTHGYYELMEQTAPNGYTLLSDAVYFKIEAGVVTWLEEGSGKPSTWQKKTAGNLVSFDAAVEANEDEGISASNAAFTIENEPGVPLPKAGGPGTGVLTLVGAVLIAVAGAVIARRSARTTV